MVGGIVLLFFFFFFRGDGREFVSGMLAGRLLVVICVLEYSVKSCQ